MEDHSRSKVQPAKPHEKKVVDLTADMAVPDQAKHKIYDLTGDMQSADNQAVDKTSADPSDKSMAGAPGQVRPTPPDDGPAATAYRPDDAETPISEAPPSAVDETMAAEPPQQETSGDSTSPPPAAATGEAVDTIEDEVDAAFDEVQSVPPSPEAKNANGKLFDKLSNITQMVDDAVRQIKDKPAPEEDLQEIIEPAPLDEATLASDAAELDAAMAGEPEEEIIDLVDKVDPQTVELNDSGDLPDDDDFIELTDVVDPTELHTAATGTLADDDIIELTDIVDPAELKNKDAESQIEGAVAEPASESAHTEDKEEELALSELDDFDPHAELTSQSAAEDEDDFEANELDDLFNDDALPTEDALEDKAPAGEDAANGTAPSGEETSERPEQIIQLADVLNSGAKKSRPPIEQIKMGADEDIANQHISLEEEVTADAIGLDLAQENAKEQQALSNKEIETAVEQILRSKYADTIERMIASAVEKAVTREIENIKRTLSDDDDPLT